jgi:hypothetical protein
MQVDSLSNYITSILPAKRKTSANGWTSFNAPCCKHRGESADTRGRGGIITNGVGDISYHCFNCHYKTRYTPGQPLSYKFRKLLSWLGADENTIRHLVIKAIQLKDQIELTQPTTKIEREPVTFKSRPLPADAKLLHELVKFYETNENSNFPSKLLDAIQYVGERKVDLNNYDFYWSPSNEHKLNQRIIIPFYWNSQIIGYSARAIESTIKPKYYSNYEPNFVFNINKQHNDNKFVIVVEGPFDAIAVDGVAILSNNCNEEQADIIDALGREVVVVPDFDMHLNNQGQKVWPGSRLIEQAIEYGWCVAFPIWAETCKDVSEAVVTYGKLFTLKGILDSKQHNKLKIELLKRKMFNEQRV